MSDHTLAYQIASEIMDTIEREKRINRGDLIQAVEVAMQRRLVCERQRAAADLLEKNQAVIAAATEEMLRSGSSVIVVSEVGDGIAISNMDVPDWSGSRSTENRTNCIYDGLLDRLSEELQDKMVNPPAFITAGHTISAEELRAYRYTGKRTSE